MARIRTIKPEFWSDEKIVEITPFARLLFIGLWNFADDYGGLDRSPRQIKMRIFPGDNLDVEPLIQELLARRLLVEYTVNDQVYLKIPNFAKHQKIDRPSAPRIPLPPGETPPRRGLVEGSPPEGKGSGSGREGKRKGSGSGVDDSRGGALEAPPASSQGDAPPTTFRDAIAQSGAPQHVQEQILGKDKGNGRGVLKVKSPRDEFIDSLDPVQRKALTDVITNGGEMSIFDKMRHLHAAGFAKETAGKAATLFFEGGEA